MAAVSIIQPDHSLEERIYNLQKRNLSADARRILEEAQQLFGEGRHIEASALVDKSEALSLSVPSGETRPSGAAPVCDAPDAANVEQPIATKLVTDLAAGLTAVLMGAIQDLERHITGETRKLTSAFSERLDKIQATVETLQPLAQRLDSLVQADTAAETKYEQVAATMASLQEADSRHEAEIGTLRLQVQELSVSAGDRIAAICHRLDEQEQLISSANSTTSELSARIAAAADRLERHADAIRTLHQERQQRAAALGQLAEALGRMGTMTEIPQMIASL